MDSLFVYGTLCFPEIVGKLTGRSFKSERAVLRGFQRKRVKNADYPAIIKNNNSDVEGILLHDVDTRSMHIISLFEGDDYCCEELPVNLNEDIIRSKVFIWDSDIEELDDDDWIPDEFLKNSFKLYLEKIIPETIHEFLKLND